MHSSSLRWGLVVACLLAFSSGCNRSEPQAAPPVPADVVTASGVRMMRIAGGSFRMGSAEGAEDERPVHDVRVDPFLMDQFEITQAEFTRYFPRHEARFAGDDNPMEQLNWQDAVRYCNKRSKAEGLAPCYTLDAAAGAYRCDFSKNGYRLPTEAEWEHACRAGTGTKYFFGDDAAQLGLYAWYRSNAAKKTHPVGRKRPNPWGLYDILGNVAEWCHDAYGEDYYARSPSYAPRGPAADEGLHVLRGGAFDFPADALRSAARFDEVGYVDNCEGREHIGFRCVRILPPAASRPATRP